MAREAWRRVGEKRLQMVINKIASARRGSLTSLVRSASPNGAWRVLWIQSASCLSSQSSLSVWWVHSFSSHRCESLWSPTDFGIRHDIKQEPLTPQQKKNRHLKGGRDSLSDLLLIWSVSGEQHNGQCIWCVSHSSLILCWEWWKALWVQRGII